MRKLVGNALIIVSLLLLGYIYLPFLLAYLPAGFNPTQAIGAGQYSISIPKINATTPIILEVDPSDGTAYKAALKSGVAQAKGFGKPGEHGLIYLFAHSSLPPWEMTRTNTAFLRLNELQNGDRIKIVGPCSSVIANPEEVKQSNDRQASSSATPHHDVCTYTYEVINKMELWPNQTEVFNQEKDKDELILQTCTPIGTDFKRLLVLAKPI
jgi:sortase (surface protein transpeptidase)